MVLGLFRYFVSVTMLFAFAAPAIAQDYPAAQYDHSVPTLEQVVGHDFGSEITTPDEIYDFLAALETARPDHMSVRSYGTSWQGRDLAYAVISSPENMQRIDEIKANTQRLANGATGAEREQLVSETPATVWLSYGVHGDEITPSDSAIFVAYHLLAAQNNALASSALDNLIILIEPMQNPDGRARFVHSFESAR